MVAGAWFFQSPLLYMGISKNRDTPKWMVKIMENPMNKWMIWGYHYFGNTLMYLNILYTHIEKNDDDESNKWLTHQLTVD